MNTEIVKDRDGVTVWVSDEALEPCKASFTYRLSDTGAYAEFGHGFGLGPITWEEAQDYEKIHALGESVDWDKAGATWAANLSVYRRLAAEAIAEDPS